VGIAANLAYVGAWAFTRTVGLPMVNEGPEAIGVADGVTVALQLALVALLAVRLVALDLRFLRDRSASGIRSLATTGLVAILSVVVLSSTIAVKDAVAGHHDGADADHDAPALMSGLDHGAMGPATTP
jgi:amino acid permease